MINVYLKNLTGVKSSTRAQKLNFWRNYFCSLTYKYRTTDSIPTPYKKKAHTKFPEKLNILDLPKLGLTYLEFGNNLLLHFTSKYLKTKDTPSFKKNKYLKPQKLAKKITNFGYTQFWDTAHSLLILHDHIMKYFCWIFSI